MKWIAVLLFAVGCAGNQSAFPVAPPFNPMLDAPITIGHPETVAPGPNPERGTDRRVLPQTQETRRQAGIWASDGAPKASSAPEIGGIKFPPAEVPDAKIVPSCLSEPDRLLNEPKTRAKFDRLIKPVQRCVAAEIYARCVETIEEDAARVTNENRRRYKLPPMVGEPKSLQDARRIEAALCKDTPRGPDSHALVRDVSNAISRSVGNTR